jgi:hypothetical protein
MGCGCKKGNQSPAPAPSTQTTQTTSGQTNKPIVSENIKQTIKKTIEKYYYVNKSSQ